MNIKAHAKKQQKLVDDWNAKHPEPGVKVKVQMDSGEVRETKTRTEATLLSGHTAVVWLEGISGCYSLEKVTAI